ncbi:MAG: hypothetical protein GY751_25290 [Bacteroidetes bacterium]|nr:hypothetical protein [Bacteroidota bacterium]
MELLLRLTGVFQVYSERNYDQFFDPFERSYDSPYWLWTKNSTTTILSEEFTFSYTSNELGLLDRNYTNSELKPTIAIFGDSFIMGSGAVQDSSMPRQLEGLLSLQDTNVYILNGGVSGSDVFFVSRYIEDVILDEGVKKIIIGVNTSDIYDYAWFGGRQRFINDSITVSKERPPYMEIYKRYFVVRTFMHAFLDFDHSFYTRRRMKQIKREAILDISEELKNLNDFILENKGDLTVVFYPYPRQFAGNSTSFSKDYSVLQSIHSNLKEHGVRSIDLKTDFSNILTPDNYLDYSWKLDLHFNARGYTLFAKLLLNRIQNEWPGFFDLSLDMNRESVSDSTDLSS